MAGTSGSKPNPAQAGLTLIELLLATALGLGVSLTALALLHSIRQGYQAIQDHAVIQDNGRYAMDVITQALRQANFIARDDPGFDAIDLSQLSPGIFGLSNSLVLQNSVGIVNPQENSKNYRSDLLAVRFFGSADGGMLNCAGLPFNTPAAAASKDPENSRGWSIFYIATGTLGEPELRCKFLSNQGKWTSASVATGVEALRVLYGVGAQDEHLPRQFLPASQMTRQQWRQVVAVRFALLVRADHNSGDPRASPSYPMFGPASLPDAVITISNPQHRGKLRQVFATTVRLRQRAL